MSVDQRKIPFYLILQKWQLTRL